MIKGIVTGVLFYSIVLFAAGVTASVTSGHITSIRSDVNEKGIVVGMSRKMPFQLIQVDDRELLLAVKSSELESVIPEVNGNDALVASISTDRLPGGIIGLIIHTKKPVVHDSTEWNETTGHVMVRLK